MAKRGRPPKMANLSKGLSSVIEATEEMVEKGEYPAMSTLIEASLNHLMFKEQEGTAHSIV